MDGREVHPPPGLQLQPPHGMVMGPNSTYPPNTSMMNPNQNPAISSTSARFPFNTMTQPPLSQPQQQQPKPPMDSLNSGGSAYDGSTQMRYNAEPTAKKKRGRPRKYTLDGGIALQLAPTTSVPSASVNHGDSISIGSNGGGGGGGGGGGSGGASSEPSAKKHRGRPPGSGKKQLDALGGVGGVGFTPHVITVKAGEDIASKIMAFSQQGPRTVCILSANGAICNVTLRQPAMSGGTVSYEGRFEIISLSGSFLFSENSGSRSHTGGLSVSLAGSDGRVLGGGVAGMLMASSPVQVIVGSFIADGKKQNTSISKSAPSSTGTPQMLSFGAAGAGESASPPSQGASSESSDENGGSPLNRGGGFYGNATPIHNNNSQMYPLWSAQAPQ